MPIRLIIIALLCSAVVSLAAAQNAPTPADLCAAAVPAADPATREYAETESVLEAGKDYYAVFCTEAGAVYIDLLEDYAPLTVNNFVFLAQQGYYNNTTFHRVIQDFMVQGGDPTATGTGGPGYQFADEFLQYLTFDAPGILAMANAGPSTNGSQFFITTVPTPHLNYRHTIFGTVITGMDAVMNIRLRDPQTDPNPGAALQTVVIVDDPSTVSALLPEAPVSTTTAEQLLTAMNALQPDLPPGLTLDESSGVRTTEDATAGAPESDRETYAEFLELYGHEYRVTHGLTNADCNLTEYPFIRLRYTIDAFATPTDASAALLSDVLYGLAEAEGYTRADPAPNTLTNGLYTKTETVCDITATHALTYVQRGRMIITAEIVVPLDSEVPADQWVYAFVVAQIYDSLLAELWAAEV